MSNINTSYSVLQCNVKVSSAVVCRRFKKLSLSNLSKVVLVP